MHHTTDRFWKCFQQLPKPAQEVSRRKFELLKANRSHPSLHFKKVGKLWSVRASMNHRALAVQDGEDLIWVWIGTHHEYERMIKEMGRK